MTNINFELLAKRVGKAIARQRQLAGLTQEQVAEHLDIGMAAISRMERGLVVPTIVRLAELAELFGCELTDLLRESSNRPAEQAVLLSQQLSRLNEADRTLLLDTLGGLVDRLSRDERSSRAPL